MKKLRVTKYRILSVEVATELDSQFRRTAIATVTTKNKHGLFDDATMHLIELKHCYNENSLGPNKSAYQNLPGSILRIYKITAAQHGDLDVVAWTLMADYTIQSV